MKTKEMQTTQVAGDIVDLILEDHKELKRLIKILKDDEVDFGDRYAAFEEFAPLLTIHAKPEEQSLYVEMKKNKELRVEGLEGDVEHALADQLLNEAKVTEDEDLWSARVKVLAELVEHHIKEEEKEMLPDFKDQTDKKLRLQLGEKFIKLKEGIAMGHPLFIGTEVQDPKNANLH
jgi:Hemerythrin HHE cation binding domain